MKTSATLQKENESRQLAADRGRAAAHTHAHNRYPHGSYCWTLFELARDRAESQAAAEKENMQLREAGK